jgi:predicted amidophosphoribosyltransferase
MFNFKKPLQFFKAFQHMVFPPICLVCGEMSPVEYCLCISCAQNFLLSSSITYDLSPSAIFSYCFDYEEPLASLVSSYHSQQQASIAKGFAAWIWLRHLHLKWALPDVIVTIPNDFSKEILLAKKHQYKIAKSLGKMMQVPVLRIIKWQMPLPRAKKHFLKIFPKGCNKRVLLIGDVFLGDDVMQITDEIINIMNPSHLQVLGLCCQE